MESHSRIFPGSSYQLERVPGSCFWTLLGSTLNFQSICRVPESVRPREMPLLDPRKFEFFGSRQGHFRPLPDIGDEKGARIRRDLVKALLIDTKNTQIRNVQKWPWTPKLAYRDDLWV